MWSSSFILQKKTMTTREARRTPGGHTAWVFHDIVQTSEHQFLYVWLSGSLFDNTTEVNLESVWSYTLSVRLFLWHDHYRKPNSKRLWSSSLIPLTPRLTFKVQELIFSKKSTCYLSWPPQCSSRSRSPNLQFTWKHWPNITGKQMKLS